MIGSVVALPALGGGLERVAPDDASDAAVESPTGDEMQAALQNESARASTQSTTGTDLEFEPIPMGPSATDGVSTTADGGAAAQTSVQQEYEDAVESGVSEGIALVQSQGVEVTQEQRTAALEGAQGSASQYQSVEAEQVQAATKGAVHGALIQEQSVNATQIQYAVGGATAGGLSQSQSVNATQLQSATWGAAHGAVAQSQRVSVEQLQVATRGAAAGAASEAGAKDVGEVPKIQEAAQGAAYGALTQYQSISIEQRQRVTLEHVQHAAAGAAAGSLEGSTRAAFTQEQRVEVEQRQRVTIKQIQKVAAGAAKGALVQEQEVSVEQTQAAARGASRGSLKQVQSVSIEQYQRISITQVQEASYGAAKGAISQSQEATVEQIQAAADGSAGGALVQRQTVSVAQVQSAATGAAEGAVTSAIQRQEVTVQQVQAAAFGASQGSVTQTQIVDVTQVQRLARGSASGALVQSQAASVTQIQSAASSASQETARVVQSQQISITQLQTVTQETAADAVAYAVREETADVTVISQHVEVEVVQRIETIDRIEGTASIDFPDQESAGETVRIEDVSLSEGGFVAVYGGVAVDADPDDIVGVSSELEAGEHENVTVELDEPLAESDALVAVVHHDTNDDGTFQYAESDGEEDVPYATQSGAPVLDGAFVTVADEPDEPNATLSVDDQTGDGETLAVAEANASVPYTVTAAYDGATVESDTFAAGAGVTNLTLDLEPPLEENATVDVSVVGEDGTALANETIEYTIADDTNETDVVDSAPEAEGMLAVVDYNIDVGEENPEDEYVVLENTGNRTLDVTGWTLQDRFDEGVVDGSGYNPLTFPEGFTLEPGETVTVVTGPGEDTEDTLHWDIETPVWNASGDDVVVLDGNGDIVLEQSIGEEQPEATLSVDDQEGDGETLEIDAASASVPYVITAEYDGQRVDSDPFEANESVAEQTLELEPPLEENATVDVSVRATADDAVLANDSIEYAVAEPDPTEPTANLTVADQTGDGETLTLTAANASVEYAITVTDENGTRLAESDTFAANETIGPTEFDLEPPLEENATLEAAVVAAADGTPIETDTVEYTVDSELEEFDVEFTNCSRAVVTASLEEGDQVAASTGFYDSVGFGNTIIEDAVTAGDEIEAPFTGTIVFEVGDERNVTSEGDEVLVEVPDYGTFGTYISGISSPEAVPFASIDYANPSARECDEQARPALPSLSVEETTPAEDGNAIDVTFGYENPNDATISGNSQFVEGTTADEPPSELEPGEGTVTVEWTPESDDERLVWAIDFANYGYDDPVTAATPPAGEIRPSEPAEFGVSIESVTSPVERGEQLAVETQVQHVGGEAGTQNVTLSIGETAVDSQSVSLEPGETETVSFTAETDGLEPGEYPLAVSTDNETAETTVTVEESGEPATFGVVDVSAPASGDPGEEVTVAATVENQGDLEGTQTVTYSVDGQPVAESTVTLAGGQTAEIPFSSTLPEGTSTHTVATDDDQASVTIDAAAAESEGANGDAGPDGESETETSPEEPGPPDDAGPPDNAGPPDDAGPPDNAGPPDDAGPPDNVGPPDDAGPPDNVGPSDDAGPNDDLDADPVETPDDPSAGATEESNGTEEAVG